MIFGEMATWPGGNYFPALYNLFHLNYLPPHFAIYEVCTMKASEKNWERRLLEGVTHRANKPSRKQWEGFCGACFYFEGDFTAEDSYRQLAQLLDANDKTLEDPGDPVVLLFGLALLY